MVVVVIVVVMFLFLAYSYWLLSWQCVCFWVIVVAL